MATVAYQLTPQLSCHAWSSDQLQLALCPNTQEIFIYKQLPGGQWNRTHVLKEHDQLVSGLDWSFDNTRLVSCSHDRNSYVFTLHEHDWKPEMVITRLSKAATCVRWSPCQHKFAIGSAAKAVCICYYEGDSHWWASKLIRREHDSSVLMVAWHPNSLLLATASSDSKCRVFSTAMPGIDADSNLAGTSTKFGECLLQIDTLSGWCHAVAWSPTGSALCFTSHGSSIHFVSGLSTGDLMTAAAVSPEQEAELHDGMRHHLRQQLCRQTIPLSHLPYKVAAFLDEGSVVAGGFDGDMFLFTQRQGQWSGPRQLSGDPQQSQASQPRSADFGRKLDMFRQQTASPANKGARSMQQSNALPLTAAHANCIVSLQPFECQSRHPTRQFSTADLDGRVILWDVCGL